MAKPKIGVLVSGRGTNLQALIAAIERGEVEAEIAVVVSNRQGVLALQRAMWHNISSVVVEQQSFATRREQQMAIAEVLRQRGVELVVLAGFDRILRPEFIRAFPYRIINIHPSLLPAFGGGLHAQAEALSYGVKVAGCTAHFVTEDVDAGPIILQATVPVMDDDTVESLSARILEQEHNVLPRAVHLCATGSVRVSGRRVFTAENQRGE